MIKIKRLAVALLAYLVPIDGSEFLTFYKRRNETRTWKAVRYFSFFYLPHSRYPSVSFCVAFQSVADTQNVSSEAAYQGR